MLDSQAESVGLGVEVEFELEDASLAAGDRKEIVGFVIGLDSRFGSRAVVFGLTDDLKLLGSIRRHESSPLVSLSAFISISR